MSATCQPQHVTELTIQFECPECRCFVGSTEVANDIRHRCVTPVNVEVWLKNHIVFSRDYVGDMSVTLTRDGTNDTILEHTWDN